MRIIPKQTKVKMQFYKGIGIFDVLIGLIALAFIALTATSNLPNKYIISVVILIIAAPLFIPIGEIKVYQAVYYAIKFGVAKKSFDKNSSGSSHISSMIPYSSIKEDIIYNKEI